MRRPTKFLLILLALHLSFLTSLAQKRQIDDAQALLRKGKDFAKVEKMMTDLLKKDSANLSNLRIYDVWLESVEKQYGELNEKMYKRQAVDTTRLFTLIRRIFTIAERLDAIDMRPDKKGRVNPEYRKGNAQRLMGYRPNLFFGGAHYLRKNNFKMAYNFFEMYIDCARQPLFSAQNLHDSDARMGEAAYWATYCGYRMNDPLLTLRYSEMARRDTTKLEYTLQYISEAWNRLGDDTRYGELLWEGFAFFPESNYFFPHLMDTYTALGGS